MCWSTSCRKTTLAVGGSRCAPCYCTLCSCTEPTYWTMYSSSCCNSIEEYSQDLWRSLYITRLLCQTRWATYNPSWEDCSRYRLGDIWRATADSWCNLHIQIPIYWTRRPRDTSDISCTHGRCMAAVICSAALQAQRMVGRLPTQEGFASVV